MPSPLRDDERGQLRVIARVWSFAELVHASFDQIRFYGASNPEVMVHLLDTIVAITPQLHRKDDREVMKLYVGLIGEDAAQVSNATDRQRVYKHQQAALRALSVHDDLAEPGGDGANRAVEETGTDRDAPQAGGRGPPAT